MENLMELLDYQQLVTQAVGFIPDLVAAIVIFVLFRALFTVTSRPARALLERYGLHRTLIDMLVDNVYRYAVMVFGLVMAADQLGVNVGAALAGIGVAGIAVGFAAQDTLSNIIAGFLIFIDKPFLVGDWVRVGDRSGEVSNITMRTTRLRTRNNTYVVIPNKKIIDETLVNYSKHGATRIDVPIGIAYKESIPEARRVILESLGDVDGLLADPKPAVVVVGLGASSVDIEARVWVEDSSREEAVVSEVTEAAKLALDAAGIEIPFPHMQLFFDDVREPVWKGLERFRAGAGQDAA